MDQSSQTILLVEDDPNDVYFLQYAFETAGITNPLQVVIDGQQAMDYLAGERAFADRVRYPFPALVLLDLKLPIKMGLEVLRWMRQRPELQAVPVIVLTSSSSPVDIEEAYRLGARSYLLKPLTVEKRLRMVKTLKEYWFEMNQLPGRSRF